MQDFSLYLQVHSGPFRCPFWSVPVFPCTPRKRSLENIYLHPLFNSVPSDKILDWFKLKAFADDKVNLSEKLKFVLGRVENIVGKGENAGD